MVGPNGARVEYPFSNKVEHVVIESMKCVDGEDGSSNLGEDNEEYTYVSPGSLQHL